MLAWPMAIRPIAEVEHSLPRLSRLRSRSAYQAVRANPAPWGGCAALGFWHGQLHKCNFRSQKRQLNFGVRQLYFF